MVFLTATFFFGAAFFAAFFGGMVGGWVVVVGRLLVLRSDSNHSHPAVVTAIEHSSCKFRLIFLFEEFPLNQRYFVAGKIRAAAASPQKNAAARPRVRAGAAGAAGALPARERFAAVASGRRQDRQHGACISAWGGRSCDRRFSTIGGGSHLCPAAVAAHRPPPSRRRSAAATPAAACWSVRGARLHSRSCGGV
jgi:hypothetical protein